MFGVPNLPQSPDIGKNSDADIFNFQISCQSLVNVFCHDSRTIDNIEMKIGPVTKIDNRNKTAPKKFNMRSCQQIVTSLLFFRFMVINSIFLSYKN